MDNSFIILTLFIMVTFLALFIYLYMKNGKRFMLCWAISVFFLMLRFIMELLIMSYIGDINQAGILTQILYLFSIVLGAVAVLCGVCYLVEDNIKKKWVYIAICFYLASVLSIYITYNILLFAYVSYFYIAVMLIKAGFLIICYDRLPGKEKVFTGFALIIWGAHTGFYPCFTDYIFFEPWSYSISTILAIIVGICIVIVSMLKSRVELVEDEKRFRYLFEKAQDIAFSFRLIPEFAMEYISYAASIVTGYHPEAFYKDNKLLFRIIHPEDIHILEGIRKKNNVCHTCCVFRIITKSKEIVWLEVRCAPVYDKQEKIVAYDGIARDISKTKKIEKRLQYLSHHDPLTGLHNRAYFEKWLNNFSMDSYITIGIIICDIDGLKLVNDTLGHTVGDTFLKDAANVIKSSFREKDFVARIGGDEFAIILTNCDKNDVERACKRLRQKLKEYNNRKPNLPINISMGYAFSNNDKNCINMCNLYKDADHKMYNNKIKQSNKAQVAMVSSILKAIEGKDFVLDGHTENMQKLMEKLADCIGLSENKMETIRQFAHLHDIGKVGISEEIIFKPGPLTKEENDEVKRHCEIGYRIALSVAELRPLADLILKHHEWWDGNGYPLGLRGEEIPLECRMLSIIDAYDVMTSSRPYRRKISHEEALYELKSVAGTQFDPSLVNLFIKSFENNNFDKVTAPKQ